MTVELDPFQMWMVRSNLQYIPEEGIDKVTDRLRAGGHSDVAAGVTIAYASLRLFDPSENSRRKASVA